MSGTALNRSSRTLQGSSQSVVSSTSSLSRSSRNNETTEAQRNRIKEQLKGMKDGDMIRIARTGFLHYAIYKGEDQIVDFVDEKVGEVKNRDLYETIGKCDCAVDNYLDKERKPLPQKEIVQRAESFIGVDLLYELGTYNCEHFATWCRYNFKSCHQPCKVAATLEKLVKQTDDFKGNSF